MLEAALGSLGVGGGWGEMQVEMQGKIGLRMWGLEQLRVPQREQRQPNEAG